MDTFGIIFSILIIIIYLANIIQIVTRMKSQTPVGTWPGKINAKKEPSSADEISDVTAFNKKHGVVWIILDTIYTATFSLVFYRSYFLSLTDSFTYGLFVLGIEALIGTLLMNCYHKYLNKQYGK